MCVCVWSGPESNDDNSFQGSLSLVRQDDGQTGRKGMWDDLRESCCARNNISKPGLDNAYLKAVFKSIKNKYSWNS